MAKEFTIATKVTDLILDSYERRARLTPGLLLVAPIFVLALTFRLEEEPIISFAISLISAGVGAYLLSVAVANLGRRIQASLWESWGGAPTTQMLRLKSVASNATQRDIWRAALESFTGMTLLTSRQENANPSRADEVITAAVGQARRLSQDAKYPLVAAENAQYGLERNLYGARWVGRGTAFLCATILGVAFGVRPEFDTALLVGGIANVALLLAWTLLPSKSRTRSAAFRYGEQLLQAVVAEVRTQHSTRGGNE